MARDSWGMVASDASRRRKLQYDLQPGYDEIMEEMEYDDPNLPFTCPFCSDTFDAGELCCHFYDDHLVELKTRQCPVCAVGGIEDLVGHLIMHHLSFTTIRPRKKFYRGSPGAHSTRSSLRRDTWEGHMRSLLGGSTHTFPPTTCVPDPLLSSFINNSPSADSSKDVEPVQLAEDRLSSNNNLDHDTAESIPQSSLSDKDQKERALRSEFVQSMLWSTIFPHDL